MRFAKMKCVDSFLRRVIKKDQFVVALFNDHPELKVFSFSKTQEYDDNNYYDSVQLQSVNGYEVDVEGNYYDEEEEVEGEHAKLPEEICRYLADYIGDISESFDDCEEIIVNSDDYIHDAALSENRNRVLPS